MPAKPAARKNDKPQSLAHKLFLANIGLYDRLFQETRGAVRTATRKASSVFDWLVEEGEEIESDVLHRLEENESFAFSEAHIAVFGRHFEKARERLAARASSMLLKTLSTMCASAPKGLA